MPRKTTDDQAARAATREFIDVSSEVLSADAAAIVALFKTAEFETTTARIGGEDVAMRRIVLTGPWEVVAQGK